MLCNLLERKDGGYVRVTSSLKSSDHRFHQDDESMEFEAEGRYPSLADILLGGGEA